MPAGSKPGERRGGRPPGGKNKSTKEREDRFARAEAEAIASLSPEEIDKILPGQVMLLAVRTALRGGNLTLAQKWGADVAPYLHAKKAPVAAPTGDPNASHQGYIVTPDQAESVEAWTRDSQRILSAEKSGDPNPDPKPSS